MKLLAGQTCKRLNGAPLDETEIAEGSHVILGRGRREAAQDHMGDVAARRRREFRSDGAHGDARGAISSSPLLPPLHSGPTAWITYLAGSR
jgi:hypothetical protein